jgi:hypothetical protein
LTLDRRFVILRSHTEINISHMRTKTLLLTAALCAAGAATSMAQVYSVNMVGYINQSFPAGFSMIANQLNASPDNRVVTLLPNPPEGTAVFQFDTTIGGYVSITFNGGAWEGDDLTMTLAPGEGAFLFAGAPFSTTFVGEVALSSSVPLVPGFQMISSALPQSLPLTGNPPAGLGFPIQNGDEVYQFSNAIGGYVANTYNGAWEGDGNGATPAPAIGESFFFNRPQGTAGSWSRTFTVGP